jgi:hypothetical protein
VFFSGNQVASINKTDHHNITDILLKVALSKFNVDRKLKKKVGRWQFCAASACGLNAHLLAGQR